MRHQAIDEYLSPILASYQVESKQEKGKLLSHAELVTKRFRKQLIRCLNKLLEEPKILYSKRLGRPLIYSRLELVPHIKFLWVRMEPLSAKRMKAGFKHWLPKLVRHAI